MQQWTDRGIKGAKYLVAGAFLILTIQPALEVAKGNSLAMAAVNLVFGVVGPVLLVAGLYLVGTWDKAPKNKDGDQR